MSMTATRPLPLSSISRAPTIHSKMPAASKPILSRPSVTQTKTPVSRRQSASTGPSPPTPASSTSTLAPTKDTSSSSGKVFAKPSKQWILPDRAKPGRKASIDEPDNKRQSQNRESQRAHRARRTDYVSTLEERIRQYEADEIHSNVRLQEVARALKADNERLKVEVGNLRAMGMDRDVWAREKRILEGVIAGLKVQVESLDSRAQTPLQSVSHTAILPDPATSYPAPLPVIATRRPTLACPICPDPDPDCPCQQPSLRRSSTSFQALTLAAKALDPTPHHSACGFCQSNDECLCRAVEEEKESKVVVTPSPPVKLGILEDTSCGLCEGSSFCACRASAQADPLFNTSPAEPAVAIPLRFRPRRDTSKRPVWTLDTPAGPSRGDAACSGDPSNCDACRDDKFGREFCSNLFAKAKAPPAFKPCADCPGNCMNIQALLNEPTVASLTAGPANGGIVTAEEVETMRCDEAWKTLKAHPNAKFASLALLADVIARRTKCLGPEDEAGSVPFSSDLGPVGTGKRRLAVETSGVREALAILDETPSEDEGTGRMEKRRRI